MSEVTKTQSIKSVYFKKYIFNNHKSYILFIGEIHKGENYDKEIIKILLENQPINNIPINLPIKILNEADYNKFGEEKNTGTLINIHNIANSSLLKDLEAKPCDLRQSIKKSLIKYFLAQLKLNTDLMNKLENIKLNNNPLKGYMPALIDDYIFLFTVSPDLFKCLTTSPTDEKFFNFILQAKHKLLYMVCGDVEIRKIFIDLGTQINHFYTYIKKFILDEIADISEDKTSIFNSWKQTNEDIYNEINLIKNIPPILKDKLRRVYIKLDGSYNHCIIYDAAVLYNISQDTQIKPHIFIVISGNKHNENFNEIFENIEENKIQEHDIKNALINNGYINSNATDVDIKWITDKLEFPANDISNKYIGYKKIIDEDFKKREFQNYINNHTINHISHLNLSDEDKNSFILYIINHPNELKQEDLYNNLFSCPKCVIYDKTLFNNNTLCINGDEKNINKLPSCVILGGVFGGGTIIELSLYLIIVLLLLFIYFIYVHRNRPNRRLPQLLRCGQGRGAQPFYLA